MPLLTSISLSEDNREVGEPLVYISGGKSSAAPATVIGEIYLSTVIRFWLIVGRKWIGCPRIYIHGDTHHKPVDRPDEYIQMSRRAADQVYVWCRLPWGHSSTSSAFRFIHDCFVLFIQHNIVMNLEKRFGQNIDSSRSQIILFHDFSNATADAGYAVTCRRWIFA